MVASIESLSCLFTVLDAPPLRRRKSFATVVLHYACLQIIRPATICFQSLRAQTWSGLIASSQAQAARARRCSACTLQARARHPSECTQISHTHTHIYLSVCLSIFLPVCLSIYLSFFHSCFLSIYQSIYWIYIEYLHFLFWIICINIIYTGTISKKSIRWILHQNK